MNENFNHIEHIEQKVDKKAKARDKKRWGKEPVSGKSVFLLQELALKRARAIVDQSAKIEEERKKREEKKKK